MILSHRFRSPTLVAMALAAGSYGALSAATVTAGERDQRFIAVRTLIERDLLLPAERQLAEFQVAGLPDAQLAGEVLSYLFADRFRTSHPDPARRKALDETAEKLKALPDVVPTRADAPEVVRDAFRGGNSPLLRLVNELAKQISPLAPPPVLSPDKLDPERKAALNRQVVALVERTKAEFDKAVAKVTANKDNEKKLWDTPDDQPEHLALAQQAALLRLDAIDKLYFPHLVMREILTRGDLHGIDKAPVESFLKVMLTDRKKDFEQWDYDYGDNFLPLRARIADVWGEGVRSKLPNVNRDEVETLLFQVVDADLKLYKDRGVREQIINLQLKTWTSLMLLQLESVDGKVPKQVQRGKEVWAQFQDRAKADANLRPTAADPGRAGEVAQVYIAAARFLAGPAKDQGAALALLGEVAAAKANPYGVNAREWISAISGKGGANGGTWSERPRADDPERALNLAKAFISEGFKSADPKMARGHYMNAAGILRNGVLGLETQFQDKFVTSGPELYNTYATTLARCELRYQAAIVAEAGLRAVARRITDKANPWKTKDGAWTANGKTVERLVNNGLSFASALLSRSKGNGPQGLYSDIVDNAGKVSPDSVGKGMEKNRILSEAQDKSYDKAIELANGFAVKYPDEAYWSFGLTVDLRMRQYDDLDQKLKTDAKNAGLLAAQKKLSDDLIAMTGVMLPKIQAELKKANLSVAQKTALEKAESAARTAEIFLLYKQEKFDEVSNRLGPAFWAHAPANESLSARMLEYLCRAVSKAQQAANTDEAKKNPQTVIARWPTYQASYEIYRKQAKRLKGEGEARYITNAGKVLANVFQTISAQCDWFRANLKDMPPAVNGIADEAKRATADLLEPSIGPDAKPELILFVADTLWDLKETVRAGATYELYAQRIADSAGVTRDMLDTAEAAVVVRPEFKGDWAKIRDYLEDGPNLAKNRELALPREQWLEEPIDYGKAVTAIRVFKDKLARQKVLLSDAFPRINDAITNLEKTVTAQGQVIRVQSRLAAAYREDGRTTEARALYGKLYLYNPLDPAFASAFVELSLDDVRSGKTPSNADLVKARNIAIDAREGARTDPPTFWRASIQVMELSAALGETKPINNTLRFNANNNSDVGTDLIKPRVATPDGQTTDDPRVRRAAGTEAKDLAVRYLALYQLSGITEKPTFRIEDVTTPDGPVTVFVAIAAPTVSAVTVEDVTVFTCAPAGAQP